MISVIHYNYNMSTITQEQQDSYTSKKLSFAKLLIQKEYEEAIELATESKWSI